MEKNLRSFTGSAIEAAAPGSSVATERCSHNPPTQQKVVARNPGIGSNTCTVDWQTPWAKAALIFAGLLSTTGCASITGSKLQPLSVQTVLENREISGIGCTLTNDAGKWFVTTPGTVTVQKSTADMSVQCRKDGIGAGNEIAVSKATGSVWGNVLAGGIIGYAVDRNTGAGFDYPSVITVSMRSLTEGLTTSAAGASNPPSPQATSATMESPAGGLNLAPASQQVAQSDTPKGPAIGQDSRQVEKLAKEASCSSDAPGILLAKGPGYETYSVACTNGDVAMYRCEFRNCRSLR